MDCPTRQVGNSPTAPHISLDAPEIRYPQIDRQAKVQRYQAACWCAALLKLSKERVSQPASQPARPDGWPDSRKKEERKGRKAKRKPESD